MGTWSVLSDVSNFFNTYNHTNRYSGLKLGNYVTIQDGTYNVDWEIAGFNMEHNRYVEDNTLYDNGYGICMIPKTDLSTTDLFNKMPWNTSDTLVGGYKASYVHNTLNTTVANNLKTILGDHLINRNVLLSGATNGTSPRSSTSSAYTWTTAYCTLMSIGQMTGTFRQNNNKYDDGEANYKLPLFNHENYKTGSLFWSRCVWGFNDIHYIAWRVGLDGSIGYNTVDSRNEVRPLIYLR